MSIYSSSVALNIYVAISLACVQSGPRYSVEVGGARCGFSTENRRSLEIVTRFVAVEVVVFHELGTFVF